MKFSTSTMKAIQKLLVADFATQIEPAGEVSVSEIEQCLRTSLQALGQASMGEMLSVLDEQTYGPRQECECQAQGQRISRRAAQVLSVFGWVRYRRSYYQCPSCGRRWLPLDEQQPLRPGRATPSMTALLGLAGITVSFEEARQHIWQYLQVRVSANTIRQETQEIGVRQAQCEQGWLAQSQNLAYLQQREQQTQRPQRVYGSIDGAFVPLEKEWKEAKLISWYQVKALYGRAEPHAHAIAYYASLEEAASFGELVWGTAVQYQADRAEELVFVCDGAAWIWKLVQHYFPQAVQIVDWYHASQYLATVAKAYPGSKDQQAAWLAKMKTFLWEGQLTPILQACQDLLQTVGAAAQKLITYYTNNQARMRYADFREAGYFIGSGTVESGCKQLFTMRLKRSGARWLEAGATAVAKARSAWLSNQWQTVTSFPLAT
jgi:hypothetical protein